MRKLYLWKAKVSYNAARNLEQKIPGLEVNLGYDHPEVMRRRLTKQLAQAETNAKDTAAEEEKLKKQLESVTKSAEEAKERLEQIKIKLEKLGPSGEKSTSETQEPPA